MSKPAPFRAPLPWLVVALAASAPTLAQPELPEIAILAKEEAGILTEKELEAYVAKTTADPARLPANPSHWRR